MLHCVSKLLLNWTVEDMKEEMESKTAEYATKYMQIETIKMDEKNSKLIEETFTQMRTKMIQLEAAISQLNDHDKSQVSYHFLLWTAGCSTKTIFRCLQLFTDSNKKRVGNESEANGDENKLPRTADIRSEKPATNNRKRVQLPV